MIVISRPTGCYIARLSKTNPCPSGLGNAESMGTDNLQKIYSELFELNFYF